MLSDVSIKKYLKSGDIVITPWDDKLLRSCGVTIHLGTTILVPDKKTVVDFKKKIIPKYKKLKITATKPYKLKPNEFVLGETWENIGLSEKVCMLIEGRSTVARFGISVTQTAMVIDAGQKSKKMTLEIKNSGPNSVLLYPGLRFCRGIFFKLLPESKSRYDTSPIGRYVKESSNEPILNLEFKDE
jgi:dCTP deaminase